jgi:hypothetical protein
MGSEFHFGWWFILKMSHDGREAGEGKSLPGFADFAVFARNRLPLLQTVPVPHFAL